MFQRALSSGNGRAAYSAAHSLPHIPLDDALRLTLLLCGERELFERCASRWLALFAIEVKGLRISEQALAASALQAVRQGSATGAVSLAELCLERGREDLARVLEDWCEGWRG